MERQAKKSILSGVWVLILMILLFYFITSYLSYDQLLQRRQQLTELKEQYQTLSDEKS